MNTRTIKNNNENIEISQLEPGSQSLHPISSIWVNNTLTNPLCLTKFNIDKKNKLNIVNEYKCVSNANNYKKYLYVPPIGFSSSDILNIYSISSIDELNKWFNDSISEKNIATINRILNAWIKVNFSILKSHNNFLEKIYIKMINEFFNYSYFKKVNELDFNKEIKNYIDYWTNKHDNNEFNLNLLDDLKNHLKKKYK
jgi:hypothetical protein